jgi:hypothetical protein
VSRNKIIRLALLGAALIGAFLNPALAASSNGSETVGVRRLTEQEYRNSIADIFGSNILVRGQFEPARRVGGLLAASTAILSITPVGFESLSAMADSIAAQVVNEKNRAELIACTPKSPKQPDDACANQVLNHYGFLLFRRPLTASELKSWTALADRMAKSSNNKSSDDFYTGLRYGLAALLQSPKFLFRTELAVPVDAKNYTLDAYSRASRLSYAFWDTTPDAELLQSAQTGELNTPAGVAKQVDRLMASPRLETGMRAFFSDMLELDTLDDTIKDTMIYQNWSALIVNAARKETLSVVIDATLKSNEDVRDLMTTRKTFINRVLASAYGVPFDFKADWVPYEFSLDSGRSGLVTQISMLSMFSHPGRSSPTERGVAIMDIFLCEPTPTPPANVDFSIVNNTGGPLKTVRERLMAHATNAACASCHTHSDPIGLTLENFDSDGSYRLAENGKLIDVSGKLQGKIFAGAAGLGKFLHDDPKFPACLARKLYAYGVGADAYNDVAPSMFKGAYQTFVDSGYRFRSLLKALATDPGFFSAPSPPKAPEASGPTTATNN